MHATLLLAFTLGAPALKEKVKPEPTIVGEWAVESVTVNAKPATPGSDRWVFRADGTRAIYSGTNVLASSSYSWDPKASPGTLDCAAERGGREANLCRYRLDGDTLVLSVGHEPAVRPADLEPAPKTTVWVFRRIGKKD